MRYAVGLLHRNVLEKYAIEMYWKMHNKCSERTTGQILVG